MIRSVRTGLLDAFLITAALTVLALRVYLAAAHYPQLGGRGLHIAHVLWGGLAMAIAIGVLLALLTHRSQLVAAVVGGAGFGLFIDELGKFLTSDNNYFFKPTPALIYTVFVVFFLLAREVRLYRPLTPRENLVNAVELAKELALGRPSRHVRVQALRLLAAADQANPLAAALHRQFALARPEPERPTRLDALRHWLAHRYAALVGQPRFHHLLAAGFVLQAAAVVFAVVYALTIAAASRGALLWVILAATLLTGLLTVAGLVALRRSRPRAYRAFEIAVLTDLLLVQPFTLLDVGFPGLTHVFIDLVLLASLRYAQHQEALPDKQ